MCEVTETCANEKGRRRGSDRQTARNTDHSFGDEAREESECLRQAERIEDAAKEEFGGEQLVSCRNLACHATLHLQHLFSVGVTQPETESKEQHKNKGKHRAKQDNEENRKEKRRRE